MSSRRNWLLYALEPAVHARFEPHMRHVRLDRGQLLQRAGDEVLKVYFPEGVLIGVISALASGETVQTGMIGWDGALGAFEACGTRHSAFQAEVMVQGEAWVMTAEDYRGMYDASPALRTAVHKYVEILLTEARQFGPLGRVMPESLELEVVGLVADVKNTSLQSDPEPAFYFSFRQFAYRSMNVVVRSESDDAALPGKLRDAVWSLDPDLPVSSMRPLEADLEDAVASERFVLVALGAFALLALALAAVGTYGVLSCAAGERKREKAVPCDDGMPTARPATTVRMASTISGTVMDAGDSWMWWATSFDMRGPPKKARNTSRNV